MGRFVRARAGAKLLVNKASADADALIQPIFRSSKAQLTNSRLRTTATKQWRLDRVQNLRRVCDRTEVDLLVEAEVSALFSKPSSEALFSKRAALESNFPL